MKKNSSKKNTANLRFALITFVTTLLIFGLVMLYSTTSAVNGFKTVFNQTIYITMGIIVAATIRRFDYRRLGFYSFGFLILVMLPLAYLSVARYLLDENIVASMPLTKMIKGACRWIKMPGFNIQPSEFAKIAIILYLAHYYEKNQRRILSFWRSIFVPFFWTGIVTGLIFMGKNLSVTVVCGSLMILMSFFAGVRLRWFILVIVAGLSISAFDYYGLKPDQRLIFKEYRMKRLSSFTDPEKVKDDEGYQLWRSQLALGSGGLLGQGFTNSILKNEYIPEAHTDFILSIVGEELGFVALVVLLFLFLGLVTIGYMISANARDYMGAYLAAGIATSILLHTLVNYSVMCGAFPTTGLTLPFISYGGSSMLANLIGIGLLLSVERHSNEPVKKARKKS